METKETAGKSTFRSKKTHIPEEKRKRRKRRRIVWIAVLSVLIITGTGLGLYYYKNQKAALKLLLPEIRKITLIRADIRQDTAYIDVFALAVNRSPYKLNIDSIYCDIYLGGKKLITEKRFIGLEQRKGQSDTVCLSVRIPISRTRSTIENLQTQDSTDITLDATVVYNTVFGKRRINLNKDKRIEVPVPPKLKIIKSQKKELRLFKKNVTADLYLQIINEGKNLNLDISGLQYELHIGNDLHTKGAFSKDISIKPGSQQLVRFPLDFAMEQPGGTILKVWTDTDRVPYKLKLSGYLDSKKIQHIPVVIFAEGKLEIVNEERKKAVKRQEKRAKKAEKRKKRS